MRKLFITFEELIINSAYWACSVGFFFHPQCEQNMSHCSPVWLTAFPFGGQLDKHHIITAGSQPESRRTHSYVWPGQCSCDNPGFTVCGFNISDASELFLDSRFTDITCAVLLFCSLALSNVSSFVFCCWLHRIIRFLRETAILYDFVLYWCEKVLLRTKEINGRNYIRIIMAGWFRQPFYLYFVTTWFSNLLTNENSKCSPTTAETQCLTPGKKCEWFGHAFKPVVG